MKPSYTCPDCDQPGEKHKKAPRCIPCQLALQRTKWHEGPKAKKQVDLNVMRGFNQISQDYLMRKL